MSKDKVAFARVGTTTKQDVVRALGRPAWWTTEQDGISSMGHDFAEAKQFMGMRRVLRASFDDLDKNLVLTAVSLPE